MADTSGSCILEVIDRARAILESPVNEAQFSDQLLVERVIPAELTKLWNSIALSNQNPPLVRFTLSVTAGTEHVVLPPNIRQIWRVGKINATTGHLEDDWLPAGEFHPWGPGWSIQQNMLSFRPFPTITETWVLWYVPSWDMKPHKGSGTVVGSARTSITLAATPTLGITDLRPHSYVGSVIRLVDNAGIPWDERVINTFNVSDRTATWTVPFASTNYPAAAASINYEIAPIGYQAVWDALAMRLAIWLGVSRNISEKKKAYLHAQLQDAVKAARDVYSNLNLRRQWAVDWRSYDNTEYGMIR